MVIAIEIAFICDLDLIQWSMKWGYLGISYRIDCHLIQVYRCLVGVYFMAHKFENDNKRRFKLRSQAVIQTPQNWSLKLST